MGTGGKHFETSNGHIFTLSTQQQATVKRQETNIENFDNSNDPSQGKKICLSDNANAIDNTLNLDQNLANYWSQFTVEYSHGEPTIVPSNISVQAPKEDKNILDSAIFSSNLNLFLNQDNKVHTEEKGRDMPLLENLTSTVQDTDINKYIIGKNEHVDYFQKATCLEEEQKELYSNVSNDYNQKLTLAKSQMDCWLKMWTDAEASLKAENSKQANEISELKHALEESEGALAEATQNGNGSTSKENNSESPTKEEIIMPINPYDEKLNQKYKELHEILQKKMAEISQLKLVNDRYSKDNAVLCQKRKGHDEPKNANNEKIEAQLKDAITAKETSKLELMVMRERNKIQDVKMKELQKLVQKQEFKINVLSSQMSEYRNMKEKKGISNNTPHTKRDEGGQRCINIE